MFPASVFGVLASPLLRKELKDKVGKQTLCFIYLWSGKGGQWPWLQCVNSFKRLMFTNRNSASPLTIGSKYYQMLWHVGNACFSFNLEGENNNTSLWTPVETSSKWWRLLILLWNEASDDWMNETSILYKNVVFKLMTEINWNWTEMDSND